MTEIGDRDGQGPDNGDEARSGGAGAAFSSGRTEDVPSRSKLAADRAAARRRRANLLNALTQE